MNKLLAAVTAVLASASLTACGSTALTSAEAPGSTAGAQADAANGLAVPDTGNAIDARTADPAAGTTPQGGGALPVPAATARGTAPSVTGPRRPPSPALRSPVSTPAPVGAPIRLGVIYPQAAALASAVGAKNKDGSVSFKRFVAGINAAGGIGGRQVTPTYFAADLSKDMSTLGQAACAALTQDHKVDIVLNNGVLGDTLPACLQRAGVAVVSTASFATDAADLARFPNQIIPDAMGSDRSTAALLTLAAQKGALKTGDKLGVLVEDCPWSNRIYQQVVTPLAVKAGAQVVKGTFKCVTNLLADLGPVSQSMTQESLRFASQGVTHVMAVSTAEAFAIAMLSKVAAQASFSPRYLVTSQAYAYNNSAPDATIPLDPAARNNLFGVGTLPLFDVGSGAVPENAAQAKAQEQCRAVDPTLGGSAATTTTAKFFERNAFYSVCDGFAMIKAILSANGVRYAAADIKAGYDAALTKGIPSATLVGGFFRNNGGRNDSAGFVRPFAYDAGSKSFVYTGAAARWS